LRHHAEFLIQTLAFAIRSEETATMSRPIFLSYRRSDSGDASRRLYEAIWRRFGADSIYMDTASTAWGEEWRNALEEAISSADVIIVVIGPNWVTAQGDWGRRRIDQPDDWVRREIELALRSNKAALPVLVGGATMPPAEALPPEIEALASRQALLLRDEEWDEHVEGLLEQLESRISATHRATIAARGEQTNGASLRAEFQAVASRFYRSSIEGRKLAAAEMANLGGLLPFDEVLAFARSKEAGERVGAGIALAAHLQTSEEVRDDPELKSTLRALLNDRRSRVRYRALEVLRGTPALAPSYVADLTWIAGHDSNPDVRDMAEKVLARADLKVG
jgi:hypothetical protein